MQIIFRQKNRRLSRIKLNGNDLTVSDAVEKIVKLAKGKSLAFVAGHSLGGLAAYLVSSILPVDLSIIVSPTPSDALAKKIPSKYRERLTEKLKADLDQIKLKPSKAKTLLIIYGGREMKPVQDMAKKIISLNKKAVSLILVNAKHHDTEKFLATVMKLTG